MIVVTGGAGFIGSNLLGALNAYGIDDVLVVDDLSDGDKFRNIADARIADYIDKDEFLPALLKGVFDPVTAVLHQGACSDTMETDGQFMLRNNYGYSKSLFEFCAAREIQFLYASSASVYGDGSRFVERTDNEKALNVYAYSKLLFDQYVRRQMPRVAAQVVGFRYFNVYGPREEHKGRMASVALHFFREYADRGYIELFSGSGGYGDGEQRRDFVWVGDVAAVNLHFLEHPGASGIYNLGTGVACSFNDMAVAVLNAVEGVNEGLGHWLSAGAVRYKPFPPELNDKYQSFTEADIGALRQSGYGAEFVGLHDGVGRYIDHLRGAVRRR